MVEETLAKLAKSKFRSSFHLRKYMIVYIDEKGWDVIQKHAYDFINQRLKPKIISNDGKQTPMKGHPVFIAQHACACCCRGCLKKWYGIPKGRELTEKEVNMIVDVLLAWLHKDYKGLSN
jgi:exodeoxyribonuclease V alpha subunit